jgi:hypothetical protein
VTSKLARAAHVLDAIENHASVNKIHTFCKKKNVFKEMSMLFHPFRERTKLQQIMLKNNLMMCSAYLQSSVLAKITILEVHLFCEGQNNPPFESEVLIFNFHLQLHINLYL